MPLVEPPQPVVFAEQFTHSELVSALLYVPVAQGLQVPPDVLASPPYPALHAHADCAVDPVPVVDEFLGHAVHATLPAVVLYVPVAQAVQLPPDVPALPV